MKSTVVVAITTEMKNVINIVKGFVYSEFKYLVKQIMKGDKNRCDSDIRTSIVPDSFYR